MSFSKKILTVAAFSMLALPAFAQTTPVTPGQERADEVNQRVVNQDARIEQGEKSGQLTNKEATTLENRDNKIASQAQKDEAANGGKLTKKETAKLNKEENHTSKAIYKKKHNDKTQPGVTPATPAAQ